MPRKREVRHQDVDSYLDWCATLPTRVSDSTASSYESDAARFFRWLGKRRLVEVDVALAARFLDELAPRARSRMVSALSSFFCFALEQRIVASDPIRPLKGKRRAIVVEGQLNFFELLTSSGLTGKSVRTLVWADFVAPLLDRQKTKIRVGKRVVAVESRTWQKLERRFRSLAGSEDLPRLLYKRIA